MSLVKQMEALRAEIQDGIKQGHDHCRICQDVAEAFSLWDKNNCFPVWLSRIVEREEIDWNDLCGHFDD